MLEIAVAFTVGMITMASVILFTLARAARKRDRGR